MGRKRERRYTYKQWEKLAGTKPKANRKFTWSTLKELLKRYKL